MDFDDLAIVIAVKNGANTIRETLASLKGPVESGAQLYIYDAKSTDDTRKIVLTSYPLASYMCEDDGGLYFAWNNAINSVKQRFLFVINCDDTLCSAQNLQALVETMRTNSRLVAASGKTQMTRADGAIRYAGAPLRRNWFIADMPVVTGASVFSVAALREASGFNTHYRISSDYDLILRLLQRHSREAFAFLDLPIIHFSLDGMSNRLRSRAFAEVREILRQNLGIPALVAHSFWYGWNGAKRLLLSTYLQIRAK